ncbi:MAG TPA: protein translocase subunit SecD [Verrucomicrobiae bacterium]|nr:protein translocase subunit SecD [Verrucomicrobiae bacterium]
MNRNSLWKAAFIIFVTLWAISQMNPPTNRNLIDEMQAKVEKADTNFFAIVKQARDLDAKAPDSTYQNIIKAAGTNELLQYFPSVKIGGEKSGNVAVLNALQKSAAGKIRLGLDLQGGTSFLVELELNKADTNKVASTDDRSRVLSQAVEVLRKRVDRFGVAEPILQPVGDNRILIQLPGLSEAEYTTAKSTISKPAFLEFRMVHEDSNNLTQQGLTEPGYEVLKEKRTRPDGRVEYSPYLVKRKAEKLTGKNVKRAGVFMEPITGKPGISFELDSEGAEAFAKITRENTGRLLAIVLDGELYSAPRINGEIPTGRGEITGSFSVQEAFELANVLENPLEAPLKLIEEQRVEPSLGQDSIKSGIRAAIIGTASVALFMIVYYFFAGFVADIALVFNIIILMGTMCSVGAVLTLPGIAGIVLTIGMAVDANVLIFERIREELAAGKSMRGALVAGYDKAFGTILDSHLTTLISSVILIFMGSGPVKGFGVALAIGVALSLFTALVVTRLIFDWLLDKGMLKSMPMLHIIKGSNIDFMKLAKPAFILSWTIILVGIGYGFYRGKGALGVDFAGGDQQKFKFTQRVDIEEVRKTVTGAKLGESQIGYQKDLAGGGETLQVTSEFGSADKVRQALQQKFPQANFQPVGLSKVGASVADEIVRVAVIASLLSLLGILIYVAMRYEYSFAVGAIIAVVHDVLMTIGCFFLTGRQLNATTVAAVLTIIGFSINDTIVIFDRIREDLKLGVRGSFRDLMNHALNRTLSRTIITSGTVLLATLSLYLFGGGGINDFAFMFLTGVITGTYSSIYIASALVLWWHKGERPKTGSQVTMETAAKAPAHAEA